MIFNKKKEKKESSTPSEQQTKTVPWHKAGNKSDKKEEVPPQPKRRELKEFEPESTSYFNVGSNKSVIKK